MPKYKVEFFKNSIITICITLGGCSDKFIDKKNKPNSSPVLDDPDDTKPLPQTTNPFGF